MKPALSSTSRASGGFTLMELLIAVVAFSVVLAAINAVFYGALHLRNRTVQAIDEAVPLRQTLTLLQRDLSNLVTPGGFLSGVLQTTRTTTSQNSSAGNMASQAAQNQPGQGSPDLYTSTGMIDETSTWGEVQKVTYFLVNSTNGTAGKDLVRSVTRNLLPTLQDQPAVTPLMTGVQSIYFTYYDGTQWKDTWDSTTETTVLPMAIKVQLTLAAPELHRAQPPPIELVVPIAVGISTNQTTTATGSTSTGGGGQ
jgi:type II secretion system protein J